MAKRIERDDLIDIPGYKEGIVDAQRTYRTFMDEAIQLTAELKKGITQTVAEIKDLRSINASGGMNTAQQNEAVERARALKQQYSDQKAAVEGLAKTQANYTATIAALEARQAKLIEQYQALEGAEGKAAQQRKRIGAELVSLAQQTDKLSKVNKLNAESAQNVAGQYNKLQKELTDAKKALRGLDDAFDSNTGKLNRNNAEAVRLSGIIQRNDSLLKKADATMGQFGRNVGNYPKALGGIGQSMTRLVGIAGQLGLALGVADIVTGIVSVTAEYERLNKQLEVTLGSKGAAAGAQKLITDFAAKTPRQIDEVSKAFNRLVDIGIVPTEKQLFQVSDVAQAKSKSMLDYVEAIADAQTGEFERLKEFSINARKAGDEISFTFKNQTTVVKNSASAINDYLISLGSVAGVQGQTEEAGKTLEGRWSTLKDEAKALGNDIGTYLKPVFNWLLNKTISLTSATRTYLNYLALVGRDQGLMGIAKAVLNSASGNTAGMIQQAVDASANQVILADPVEKDPLAAKRDELKAQAAKAERERQARIAAEKAKKTAEGKLREALQTNQANQQLSLSQLDTQKSGLSDAEFLTQRLIIIQNGALKEQDILRKAGKANSAEYIAAQTKINEAAADYIAKRNEIEEKAFKDALGKTKDAISSDSNLAKAGLQDRLTELEDAYNKENASIQVAVARREITEQQGEQRLHDLKLTYLDDIQRATLAAADTAEQRAKARIAELRAQGKSEAEIAETLKLEKEAIDKAEEQRKDASAKRDKERSGEVADKEIKDAERAARKKQELIDLSGQVALQGVATFSEIATGFRDAEIAALEKQKTYELSLVGDNAEAKAAIEKKYDQQSREIKRRQAIADKAAAVFSIAINTAVAASKVLAEPFLLPLTLALGALQLAAVIAKPIPEFFRGTSDAPEGPAWVGERGYELIESKQGGKSQYRLAAEKQITYLNRHDRVYTHQETKRMLATNAELAQDVRSAPGGSLYQPPIVSGGASKLEMLEIMRQVFGEMEWQKTVVDKNGLREYTEKQNNKTEWLSKRMSFPKSGKR